MGKWVRRSWAVALFVVALPSSLQAEACSCAPKPSPKNAVEAADAVFLGTVVKFEVQGNPEIVDGYDGQHVAYRSGRQTAFQVRTVWKGPHQETFTVRTGEGGGDCGVDFMVGHEYLVYAGQTSEGYRTNICTRTRDVWFSNWEGAKEDFQVLGPGTSLLKR